MWFPMVTVPCENNGTFESNENLLFWSVIWYTSIRPSFLLYSSDIFIYSNAVSAFLISYFESVEVSHDDCKFVYFSL